MVDDEVQRSAGELFDTAAKLRALARRTRSAEACEGLLDLADRFERMARRINGGDASSGSKG